MMLKRRRPAPIETAERLSSTRPTGGRDGDLLTKEASQACAGGCGSPWMARAGAPGRLLALSPPS
jgi:hypothetical protein